MDSGIIRTVGYWDRVREVVFPVWPCAILQLHVPWGCHREHLENLSQSRSHVRVYPSNVLAIQKSVDLPDRRFISATDNSPSPLTSRKFISILQAYLRKREQVWQIAKSTVRKPSSAQNIIDQLLLVLWQDNLFGTVVKSDKTLAVPSCQ